jgi:hypothetical protein
MRAGPRARAAWRIVYCDWHALPSVGCMLCGRRSPPWGCVIGLLRFFNSLANHSLILFRRDGTVLKFTNHNAASGLR